MLPKIELHVHLEGTVRAATLLDMAKRNDVGLPAAVDAEPGSRKPGGPLVGTHSHT